jgi:hypothetical protein
MTRYRIDVINEAGRVTVSTEISRATDEQARVAAKRDLKAGGQAEVWSGERCVGQVSDEDDLYREEGQHEAVTAASASFANSLRYRLPKPGD